MVDGLNHPSCWVHLGERLAPIAVSFTNEVCVTDPSRSELAPCQSLAIGSVGGATVRQRGVEGGLCVELTEYAPGVLGSRIDDLERRT